MSTLRNIVKLSVAVVVIGATVMLGIFEYVRTRPVIVQYYGEIKGDTQYFSLLSTLRNANYGQRIDIYMISPGGSVLHGNEIARAMRETHGYVVYHVGSLAASMAAVLACQADKLDVAPSGILMFHTLQVDGQPLLNPVNPDDIAFMKALHELERHCKFLTQKDIIFLDNGGELWLTGNEVQQRLHDLGAKQDGNI